MVDQNISGNKNEFLQINVVRIFLYYTDIYEILTMISFKSYENFFDLSFVIKRILESVEKRELWIVLKLISTANHD